MHENEFHAEQAIKMIRTARDAMFSGIDYTHNRSVSTMIQDSKAERHRIGWKIQSFFLRMIHPEFYRLNSGRHQDPVLIWKTRRLQAKYETAKQKAVEFWKKKLGPDADFSLEFRQRMWRDYPEETAHIVGTLYYYARNMQYIPELGAPRS